MQARNIEIPEQILRTFCEQNKITRLSLFGSVLRNDFTPSSDIDLLVEFDPNLQLGLIGFAEIENKLTDLLGRTVDLNTADSLSPYFRDQVLAEAETVYVEA